MSLLRYYSRYNKEKAAIIDQRKNKAKIRPIQSTNIQNESNQK